MAQQKAAVDYEIVHTNKKKKKRQLTIEFKLNMSKLIVWPVSKLKQCQKYDRSLLERQTQWKMNSNNIAYIDKQNVLWLNQSKLW